jgi:hypothetical protein
MLPSACGARLGVGRAYSGDPLETEYGPVFGPEDAAQLTAAFEAALSKLGLVDRTDPMTMTVAKLIIQLAKNGERDLQKLCDDALKSLGK